MINSPKTLIKTLASITITILCLTTNKINTKDTLTGAARAKASTRTRTNIQGAKMFSLSRPKPDPIKEGEESVWDYPRPPRLEKVDKKIEVFFNGQKIVEADGGYRILETSHPPTYYIDPKGFKLEYFKSAGRGGSFCEWKGYASYYDVEVDGKKAAGAAWTYKTPTGMYSVIKDHIAIYAAKMDYCTVGGEKVTPQPGNFYGGWITSWVKGPFKGIPGSMGW